MKELSFVISVYPISDISSLSPDPWKNDQIGDHTFFADDFSLDPTPSESEPGVLFACDHTFFIDTPSDQEVNLFNIPVNSILVVKDTSGNKYPIGNILLPGTAQIQRGLQKSRLIFKCNCLSNPF